MSVDRLLAVTSLVRREAIRRDGGEVRDPRFDVAIAMLLDLADELHELCPPSPQDVDRLVERLHGAIG